MEGCLRDGCWMTWWSTIRSWRDQWPMSLKLYNWRDGKSVINSFTDHQYTERSILQWQTVWLSEENNLCYNNTTHCFPSVRPFFATNYGRWWKGPDNDDECLVKFGNFLLFSSRSSQYKDGRELVGWLPVEIENKLLFDKLNIYCETKNYKERVLRVLQTTTKTPCLCSVWRCGSQIIVCLPQMPNWNYSKSSGFLQFASAEVWILTPFTSFSGQRVNTRQKNSGPLNDFCRGEWNETLIYFYW